MIARMGLSNRLNLIVISLNLLILVVVAVLASTSSDAALRNQAVERFNNKTGRAFNTLNKELNQFEASTKDIVDWVSDYRALNLSTNVQIEILKFLADDNDILIHRVGLLRPDNSAVWINIPDPLELNLHRRGIENSDSFSLDSFPGVLDSETPIWFAQEKAVFDPLGQAAMTLAIPYEHETGRGMIWFDIPQSVLDERLVEVLNHEGLLFETASGYTLVVDSNSSPIVSESVDISTANFEENLQTLLARHAATKVSDDDLYHFADPFNADKAGLFNVHIFDATGWAFITVLPVNDIPVLPNDVLLPIIIVAIAGIVILIYSVNRFIDRSVVQPLVDLGRSASEIGEGNLRFIVFHQDKKDEIGELANALDRMRDRLRASYDALQQSSRTLEQRVEERTEELAQARKEAELNAEHLRLVYDESLSVVNESQLGPVLNTFIDRILFLLDASYCSVWLLEQGGRQVRLVATNDEQRRTGVGILTIPSNVGIVGQAMQSDQSIIVNDYVNYNQRYEVKAFENEARLPFNRAVCAPLKFSGLAVGAVIVGRLAEAKPFDIQDQQQLTLFTNMVSPSVRNAQLFIQLQEAVHDAERANDVKTRFLASVTHELRTPLNLVINNMDFMRVGAFGAVNDEQVGRLNQTVRSAEHLLYLINDLLDVSKIEAGEMQLFIQSHEIYTMLEDAIDNAYALLDTYEEKAGKVTLRVEIEEDLPEMPMDARRIRQVLNNLLSNAIKFTLEGTITLKVFQEEEGIHFSVHDTGIGIPDEERDKLFAPFERTQIAKQQGIEGTGLGLPISRFLVQQHGSDLNVISQVGEGSTFVFMLPFKTPETISGLSTDTQQMSALLSSKNKET
jgi:signal transduction histidine kinase/HAMP domain-containing protein